MLIKSSLLCNFSFAQTSSYRRTGLINVKTHPIVLVRVFSVSTHCIDISEGLVLGRSLRLVFMSPYHKIEKRGKESSRNEISSRMARPRLRRKRRSKNRREKSTSTCTGRLGDFWCPIFGLGRLKSLIFSFWSLEFSLGTGILKSPISSPQKFISKSDNACTCRSIENESCCVKHSFKFVKSQMIINVRTRAT